MEDVQESVADLSSDSNPLNKNCRDGEGKYRLRAFISHIISHMYRLSYLEEQPVDHFQRQQSRTQHKTPQKISVICICISVFKTKKIICTAH